MKELKFIESGKKLRAARERAKMTLSQAKKRTGIPSATISDMERGLYDVPLDRAQKLATAYGVPVESLTGKRELPARDPTAEDLLTTLRGKNKKITELDQELKTALAEVDRLRAQLSLKTGVSQDLLDILIDASVDKELLLQLQARHKAYRKVHPRPKSSQSDEA